MLLNSMPSALSTSLTNARLSSVTSSANFNRSYNLLHQKLNQSRKDRIRGTLSSKSNNCRCRAIKTCQRGGTLT